MQSKAKGQERSKKGCALGTSFSENLSGSSRIKSFTCSHVLSLERPPAGTSGMLEQCDLRWYKKGTQWIDGSRLRRRCLGVLEEGLFGSLKPGTCP